jgi:hypothetical protein
METYSSARSYSLQKIKQFKVSALNAIPPFSFFFSIAVVSIGHSIAFHKG